MKNSGFSSKRRHLYSLFSLSTSFLLSILLGNLSPLSAQEALSLAVNSSYEEREPVLSDDGSTLYFWRRKTPDNIGGPNDPGDIWYASQGFRSGWSYPEHFKVPLNTRGQEFVWQVSPDHDTLWMVSNNYGAGPNGVGYIFRNSDGYWSRLFPVYIKGFQYKGDYKDFYFSDQRVMVLVNEGKTNYGGSDLYLSFPKNDTAWHKPVNMGPMINTEKDEDAPFLTPDGKALYFNSNGRGGSGEHDIFVSYRLDDTWRNWSEPVNLGAPINTSGYEFDFFLTRDGKWAYWGSDREGGKGGNDIYRLDLEDCEVNIYPEGDLTVCTGETLELEGGFLPGAGMNYQWLKNGSPVRGGERRRLTVSTPGLYQLVRTTPTCRDTSIKREVKFVDPPEAKLEALSDILCVDDSVALKAVTKDGTQFQWRYNSLELPNAKRSIYWAQRPGTYTVEITLGQCKSISNPLIVNRFEDPDIFLAKDTALTGRAALPHWLWTNKIPQSTSSTLIHEVALGTKGETYILASKPGSKTSKLSVYAFSPEGLSRGSWGETKIPAGTQAYLASTPRGDLIVADDARYLSCYSKSGNLKWTKDREMSGIVGMTVDDLGYIYTAGRYEDTLYLGSKKYAPFDRGSLFLARYTPTGELQWVQTFAMDNLRGDMGNSLQTDENGNVYLAGPFRVIANFRSKILRASLKGENYFLAKFDAKGKMKWVQRIATERTRQRTGSFYVDPAGYSYLSLNRELWAMDPSGGLRWKKALKTPGKSSAVTSRVGGTKGEVYIAGVAQDETFFVVHLNKLDKQAVIWKGDKAVTEFPSHPAIIGDGKGSVWITGLSKGKDFPGAQFDLTSKSKGFLLKYGLPDGRFQRESIEICKGDKITLVTRQGTDYRYQWYQDGLPLPNTNQYFIETDETGTYQVQITNGPCERLSQPRQVIGCDEDPMRSRAITVADVQPLPEDLPPPAPEAIREPEKETDTDIAYTASGEPKKLRNRRVSSQKVVEIEGRTATIYLWDHGAMDNDTVSVNVNGQWLLEEYRLEKQRYAIEYTFEPGNNYIILYALNLGGTPPNTASIMVDDGVNQQILQLRSTLKTSGMLRVRVRDE
ncbi:MAG: hypothetical protein AAFO96_03955 [Bacteroidota bacterium]